MGWGGGGGGVGWRGDPRADPGGDSEAGSVRR